MHEICPQAAQSANRLNAQRHMHGKWTRMFWMGALAAVHGVLWTACANIRPPTGGEADTQGPSLLFSAPPERARNFIGDEVRLYFDEFLKPGVPKSEVFISPVMPATAYEVRTLNKRLTVAFNKPLAPNTTYVMFLGKGVQDFAAGNPIDTGAVFAFSTGPNLDSCAVRGSVTNARTGQPEAGLTVLLFDTDSVPNGDLRNAGPRYAAATRPDGSYELPFLAPGSYIIAATDDADRNYRYNQPTERLALANPETLRLAYADSIAVVRNLVAFTPDSLPGRLAGIRWLQNQVAAIEFTEPMAHADVLLPSFPGHNPQDTLRLAQAEPGKPRRLLLALPGPPPDSFHVRILHATDTLGNRFDTSAWAQRPARGQYPRTLAFAAQVVKNQPFTRRFYVNSPLAQSADAYISLRDTAQRPVPITIKKEGFFVEISPENPAGIDTNLTYTLTVDSAITSVEGLRPDSTLRIEYRAQGVGLRALVAGTFVAQAGGPPLIFEFVNTETKEVFASLTPAFRFPYMPAGTYSLQVVEDANADGVWTPGQAFPRQLPEAIRPLNQSLKVRPGWSFENLQIEVPAWW